MPIGSLGMLRIGDIWQDGKLIAQPKYSREVFLNLDIGAGTTKLIKAGVSVDDHYLLPFSAHPWHRPHTNAYCVAVKVSDDTTLIMPGAEMIRFYFGSCSILLHRLFTEPFKEARLFREKHYDPERRHLHLKLADGIPRFAVPDIARIATESHARRAAEGIYAHCLAATVQGEKAYPYTVFPFHGKTTLSTVGMWLPFAGEGKRTFLAFQLRSCSHPFGFNSVTFDPCERAPWRKDVQDEKLDKPEKKWGHRCRKKLEQVLDDVDPGAGKEARHFVFDDQIRFPDLRHKPVRLREIVVGDAREVLIRHSDGTLEKVSFGDPSGSSGVRAVDACVAPSATEVAPETERLPAFVRAGMAQALTEEDRRKRIVVKPLVPFGEESSVFPLPMIVDEDGVVDPAPHYTEPDGHHRMRRACFVGLFDADTEIRKLVIIEGPQLDCPPLIQAVMTMEIPDLAAKIDSLEA